MAEHEHDEGEHHHHAHEVGIERSVVDDSTLKMLDDAHPALAEMLSLTRRLPELTEDEKKDFASLHETMEKEGPWIVGLHAEGDACAVCAKPVEPLFADRLEDSDVTLEWSAFAHDLPVHVACVPLFDQKFPRLAPRVLDQARRASMRDLDRPSAQIASFFRHDLVVHGKFGLEDWANSVYEANEENMTRNLMRDVQKCIHWVHARLHHGEPLEDEDEDPTQR